MDIDPADVPTPCYVCDEGRLERNLKILASVQHRTGCRILLALKGFAMFSLFPLTRNYLSGVSASSLDEARLGADSFGRQVHLCAPAYRESEFDRLLKYSTHIVFNSISQWARFKLKALGSGKQVHCGLRINPEHSEVSPSVYDPCQRFSRLGITRENFPEQDLEGITGIHFHSLCQRNSDALERTLGAVEKKFGEVIHPMNWINLGGGRSGSFQFRSSGGSPFDSFFHQAGGGPGADCLAGCRHLRPAAGNERPRSDRQAGRGHPVEEL